MLRLYAEIVITAREQRDTYRDRSIFGLFLQLIEISG
jgi:hypothetical protein